MEERGVLDLMTFKLRYAHEEPPFGSYRAFRGPTGAEGHGRIDRALTRGAAEPLAAALVTDERGGQYPSDHFPVTARGRGE